MISKPRLSRWVMYMGILGLIGAATAGHSSSAVTYLFLIIQQPIYSFYRKRTGTEQSRSATTAAE